MTTDVLEERVRQVLHQQGAQVTVPPPDPYSVLSTSRAADDGSRRGDTRHRLVLVGVMVLVAVGAGVSALSWVSPGTETTPATESTAPPTSEPSSPPPDDARAPGEEAVPNPTQGPGFDFNTQVGVRLRADEVTVEANGLTFVPVGDIDLSGDPGYPASGDEPGYKTLELIWRQHDVEMRINLYFASDDQDWWISEIRTYDGNDPGDWITMTDEQARTPLGQAFAGDIAAGPLRLTGLELEAFVPRSTTCDGSGAPGQIHLELVGPEPIRGELLEGLGTGYGMTVAVLDAATCEPLRPEGIEFVAATAPEAVATVDADGPVYSPEWAPDELRVSLSFVGVGETTLTIDAVDQETQNVLASVDISVVVDEGGNP
ncbi:MAG: hypothetical protein AAF962_10725 [Actinomycetota bacterium]